MPCLGKEVGTGRSKRREQAPGAHGRVQRGQLLLTTWLGRPPLQQGKGHL